jgi:nonsense-mediated mRNA decay protein 3
MFCPQCGSSDVELLEGLCKNCFLKEFQPVSIPDEIGVTLCAHCHSNLQEGKWKELGMPEEEIIYRALEENIQINPLLENPEIDLEILQMRGSIAECIVSVTGNVLGDEIAQEYKVNVRMNKSVCPDCSKFNSGYYESVIQLRSQNRTLSPEEIQKADKVIKETLARLWEKNRMAYLAQRAQMKEGIDYYIGSQKSAKRLVASLREVFGGVVKESPRLMGEDKSTGKGLYRVWISLRLGEFKIGDFISYKNHLGPVLSIAARKIVIMDLESMEKFSVLWKEHEKIKMVAKSKDIQITTISSKSPHEIQILHPTSFQPLDLAMNPHFETYEIGEEISVIDINGKIYILPKNE